jgi:predicted transcriptional regulator
MTLTVRLDDTLEAALERYCQATGSSKSLVVQESLATYLVSPAAQAAQAAAQPQGKNGGPSDNFLAFAAAGLLGTGTLPELAGGATKAAVRERALARLTRQPGNKPRPNGA